MLGAEFSHQTQAGNLSGDIVLLQDNISPSSDFSFSRNRSLQLNPLPAEGLSRSANRSITGNRLDNKLTGTTGNDRIRGLGGNDRIRGLGGADWISGDQGNDRLLGGAGDDRLLGGSGNNQLSGETGNDQLIGGKGNDRLLGGSGADILTGNGGTDQLTGGANSDRFVLRSGSAQITKASVITDFNVGEDSLDFGSIPAQKIRLIAGTGNLTGNLTGSTIVQNPAGETLAILRSVRADSLTVTLLETPPSAPISPSPAPLPTPSPAPISSIRSSTVAKFSPNDSEATIAATGATKITVGTQTIYIGMQQVTSINQNPIVASFDSTNPANRWVKTNYEVTGADGRGYGLFWSGSNLYAMFSVDGTQGTPDQDFRRASSGAVQPWLRSYGRGGGPKVAVIARLNPATGEMTEAAYLSAVLSSGNSNSLEITGITQNSAGNLVVSANSWFAPRRPDGTAMTQTTPGSSPFNYTVEMTSDLRSVVSTSAIGWT
ncbi:calcium-binding protein [Leptolyngbya ohadii]|uniref:calcium-binding protein n=1 Tax=Leptolyngbya ohadii TaxID=1962290 RepID=UPI000B59E1E9|nr:calcium-binding protein [Leptolyngbya ohadii]